LALPGNPPSAITIALVPISNRSPVVRWIAGSDAVIRGRKIAAARLPAGAATLAPILRTEDLTVRFGGPPALNQVNFKASETKGPCPQRHRAADAVRGRGVARQGRGEP
jgi:hypothetical protein